MGSDGCRLATSSRAVPVSSTYSYTVALHYTPKLDGYINYMGIQLSVNQPVEKTHIVVCVLRITRHRYCSLSNDAINGISTAGQE